MLEQTPGGFANQAVMERDKEEGHFERQAQTMDIIDTYIHDNAPWRVDLSLSEPCRQRILASEVTRCVFAHAILLSAKSFTRSCGLRERFLLFSAFRVGGAGVCVCVCVCGCVCGCVCV